MINKIMSEDNHEISSKRPRTSVLGQFADSPQHGEHNAYAKFLATLTPEEYKEHCAKRKQKANSTIMLRKGVRELWLDGIQQRAEEWNQLIQRAAESVLQKAIERGDPVAFNAITDRILGKVAQTMKVEVEKNDSENDILERIQAVAMEGAQQRLSHQDNIVDMADNTESETDNGKKE